MSQVFAHPVLAPWSSDYIPTASFSMESGESVPADLLTDQLSIPISYDLQCATLETMISEGSASYVALATSPRTMVRQLYQHRDSGTPDEVVVLRMSDFAHDITLTPYITSTKSVVLPVTGEHDREFHEAGRMQFALPAGSVLALGDGVKISSDDGNVTSIIDIVASSRVDPGQFMLDYEDTRIKVLVNPVDQSALKTMRTGSPIARATLYPGLYLHAVVGAITRLSEHKDTAWASVVASALERHGLSDIEDDRTVQDAHIHAQKLLEAPLGHLLTTFVETNNDN